MKDLSQPVFPVHLISLEQGERTTLENPEHLRWQFEEYDPDDPDFADRYCFYDALLRPLRVRIKLMRKLTTLEIANESNPLSLDQIESYPLVPARISMEAIRRMRD